jgi:hypothetical protein
VNSSFSRNAATPRPVAANHAAKLSRVPLEVAMDHPIPNTTAVVTALVRAPAPA